MNSTRRTSPWRKVTVAGIACCATSLAATAAYGHASFPGYSGFGFQPNTSGGTGAEGSTPPYAANTPVTVYLRAPFEQSVPYDGSDDTTVEVAVIVPDGWTAPTCGSAKKQVKDASTNNTNQPGADVAGWSCEIYTSAGHSVIRLWGPQVQAPVTAADSAQFFTFGITTPSPSVQTTYNGTGGTEGFIVDQTYASGERVHWIPSADFPGSPPPGSTSEVASGLARSVAAYVPEPTTTTTSGPSTTAAPSTTAPAATAAVTATPTFTG